MQVIYAEVKQKQDAPCVLALKIAGCPKTYFFLVDTGASACILKASTTPELFQRLIRPNNSEITGITANTLPFLGTVSLPFQLGNACLKYETFVVPDECLQLKVDGILSRRFLYDNEIFLRGKNDELHHKGQIYPMYTMANFQNEHILHSKPIISVENDTACINKWSEASEASAVEAHTVAMLETNVPCPLSVGIFQSPKVTKDHILSVPNDAPSTQVTIRQGITLSPRSINFIPAYGARENTGQFIFRAQKDNVKHWDVYICPSLNKLESERKFTIFLINAGPNQITIPKNTVVGDLVAATRENLDELMDCQEECCQAPVVDDKQIYSYDVETAEIINENSDLLPGADMPEEFDIEKLCETSHLSDTDAAQLIALLKEYEHIFFRKGQKLSVTPAGKMDIDTGDHRPICEKPRPIAHHLQRELDLEIDQLLQEGIIEPRDNNVWNSNIILLRKTTDSGEVKRRLCLDLRRLNAITTPIAQHFPDIFDVINKSGHCELFSALDLYRAYNQCELTESAVEKCGFTIPRGSFVFKRVVFGLRNAPLFFQNIMTKLLSGKVQDHCSVYLDDILVTTKEPNVQEHLQNLRDVFEILSQANLKIRLDKSVFIRKEIDYLGFHLTRNSITPLDRKMKIIAALPSPKSKKALRSAISLFSFFRKFIPNFAEYAYPLNQLLHKDARFIWSPLCEFNFSTLKEKLVQKASLAFPDYKSGKPLRVYVDSSNVTVGGALVQEQLNPFTNSWEDVPIQFASRGLSKAEHRYEIYRKELLSVCYACKAFEYYLLGTTFELITDCKAIAYLFSGANLKPAVQRLALYLSQFSMDIIHIKGKDNVVGDLLSRLQLQNGKLVYLSEIPPKKQNYLTYSEFVENWEAKLKAREAGNNVNEIKLPRQQHEIAAYEWRPWTEHNEHVIHVNKDDKIETLENIARNLGKIQKQIEGDTATTLTIKEFCKLDGLLAQIMDDTDKVPSEKGDELYNRKRTIYQKIEDLYREIDGKYEAKIQKLDLNPSEEDCEAVAEIVSSDVDTESRESDQDTDHEREETSSDSTTNSDCELDSEDEKHQIMLRHDAFPVEARQKENLWELDTIIDRNKIKTEQLKDPKIRGIIERLKTKDKTENMDKYELDDDDTLFMWSKTGKLRMYIPPTMEEEVIRNYHESLCVNHAGIKKLSSLMRRRVYIPNLDQKIQKVLNQCETCAITKPMNRPIVAPMKLYSLDPTPFQTVHLDFSGPHMTPSTYLGTDKDYKYALIAVDRLSHWIEIYKFEEITANSLIKCMFENFFPTHLLPRKFVTDLGTQFVSLDFKEMCKKLNIRLVHSSPQRPQSNAKVESSIKFAKTRLTTLTNKYKNIPWFAWIPSILISLRTQVNEATKYEPFRLLYGREMVLPNEAQLTYSRYRVDEDSQLDFNIALWKTAWDEANLNLERYQQKTKARYDTKTRPHNIQVGQRVFIKNMTPKPGIGKVYQQKYLGPYTVVKINDVTAQVKKATGKIVTIHVDRLKPMPNVEEIEQDEPAADITNISAESSEEEQQQRDSASASHRITAENIRKASSTSSDDSEPVRNQILVRAEVEAPPPDEELPDTEPLPSSEGAETEPEENNVRRQAVTIAPRKQTNPTDTETQKGKAHVSKGAKRALSSASEDANQILEKSAGEGHSLLPETGAEWDSRPPCQKRKRGRPPKKKHKVGTSLKAGPYPYNTRARSQFEAETRKRSQSDPSEEPRKKHKKG